MLTRHRFTAQLARVAALGVALMGVPVVAAYAVPAVPGTPTSVAAVASPRTATISWTPADGTADSYLVLSSPSLKSCTADAPATTCTISGLVPSKTYKFKVLAGNDSGESAWSSFSNSIVPADKPNKINGVVSVVAGDSKVTASWNAQTDNVGSAVTSYTATATPVSAGSAKSCTVNAPATTCTINDLINGSYYAVSVIATNAVGSSVPSNTSSSFKPVGLPIGPASVTATSLSHESMRVSWVAAQANGGSTPTYTVTRSPAGTNVAECNTDSLSCDVSGLTAGIDYTFTVVANNGVGNGSPVSSLPASPVATNPNAPTGVSATAGDGTATVKWTASTTRGAAVTGYIVTANPGGKTCSTTTETTCAISGLNNNTSYTFTVVADSEKGASLPSTGSFAVTPSGKPFAPTNVLVSDIGKGTITRVSWTASDANGSAITQYSVTSVPAGASCAPTSDTFCDLGGLVSGTSYTFRVYAANANGDSPVAVSASFTPQAVKPGKLTDVKMKRANGSLTISVGGLEFDGGFSATYKATITPTGKTCTITPDSLGAGSCKVTGLDNATLYDASVVASNSLGSGPATDLDPPFDVWISANTVVKGGSFTAYFVGALPRATVSLTFGKTVVSVKASTSGNGSATLTANAVGVTEVKASYGIVRASAGLVGVAQLSLSTKAKVGSSVNLVVLYAGKNATVEVTKVGVGVVNSTNTGDASNATFAVDTSVKGKVTYRVSINGVTQPDVSVTIS
jgi:hypothetical protein